MASIPITIVGVMTYTDLEATHPIAPGGSPPGIWGPTDPRPTPPIYYPPAGGGGGGAPVYPSHPIYYPPGIWGPTDPRPSNPIAPGGPPLGIWGGGNVPYPTPPIYYPPPEAPTEPPSGGDGRWGYVPGLGWVWVPADSDKPHPPQTPA